MVVSVRSSRPATPVIPLVSRFMETIYPGSPGASSLAPVVVAVSSRAHRPVEALPGGGCADVDVDEVAQVVRREAG